MHYLQNYFASTNEAKGDKEEELLHFQSGENKGVEREPLFEVEMSSPPGNTQNNSSPRNGYLKVYEKEFQTYRFILSEINQTVSLKGQKQGNIFYVEVSSADVEQQTNYSITNGSDLYTFLQNGLAKKHSSASLEIKPGEKRQKSICDCCCAFNIR